MNKFLDKIGLSYFYSKIMEQIARQSIPSGGKTGQILVKRSDDNYDCYWGDVEGGSVAPPEDGIYEWWSPKMTSNTAPAPYVASATTNSVSQSAPYHAFDGVAVAKQQAGGYFTGGLWSSQSGGGYVQIDFGKIYTIRGFKINIPYRFSGVIAAPNRMKILGSNNENNWEVIGDYKNIEWHSVEEYSEFMLDKSAEYRYYRFGAENLTAADMPSADYTNFCIGDVEFFKLEEQQ